MKEKKCKHCAMMIPKEAKLCPHCRKRQGWTWPAKIFLGLILLFAVMPVFVGSNKTSSPSQGIDSVDAYIAAKKFVSQKLKYPHTANFAAHLASDIKQKDADIFEVTSYVDSQNDFGASIRTNFTYELKHIGNKRWVIINAKTW